MEISVPETDFDEEDYQENAADDMEPIYVDTFIKAHEINISKDSIKYWKNKRQFAYMKNLDSLLRASQAGNKQPVYEPSFLERLLRSNIFSVLAWMICGFVVLLIAYQVFRNNGLFSGNRNNKKLVEEYIPEDQAELAHDFDQLINQAYKLGDFRMAVRYEFLRTLKNLRNKGHIEFAIDKTNSKYLAELPQNWRPDFRSLIHDYEYVWYGHFTIEKEQYISIQKKFASFTRLMQ